MQVGFRIRGVMRCIQTSKGCKDKGGPREEKGKVKGKRKKRNCKNIDKPEAVLPLCRRLLPRG